MLERSGWGTDGHQGIHVVLSWTLRGTGHGRAHVLQP